MISDKPTDPEAPMNASDSAPDEDKRASRKRRRFENSWAISLFGTAVGAGILFLPMNAGSGGVWPLIIATLLIGPMTFFAHRGLSRFVSASANPGADITVVARELFGPVGGQVVTVLYFLAIFPIVMIYGIAITNTVDSLLVEQLHWGAPPRWLLSGVLIALMMLVMILGQRVMLVAMQWLVYPLIAALLGVTLFLIPSWQLSFITETTPAWGEMGQALLLVIPVLIFAFNFSPAVSQYTLAMQRRYGPESDARGNVVLRRTTMLLVVFTMGFVWSTVLALGADGLQQAREANLPVLSYLAQVMDAPFIEYLGPAVAIAAIGSSFFGHYLGAAEGAAGIVRSVVTAAGKEPTEKTISFGVAVFIFLSTWVVAILDVGILDMIETLAGPIIAVVLYLMPMYAIHRFDALEKYRGKASNVFTTVAGIAAVACIIYRIFVVGL
ncbi:MAG TPA: HAAAP family serine/threonine permease [Enteractinococcus helveticum]|uniref:HAAAP family serine/threonine permease n=1 Tax=Enteractinococcus helveticum TaxID=1837282 RepID=A0A921K926_9MICC|nr:HAAAP family serine/threonine permease [Enteractinococcus helveticum]HJF14604.1 HAAAP family serine/threonine permease [Enteractinococcus helveticum]